jgi:hypothetical protein
LFIVHFHEGDSHFAPFALLQECFAKVTVTYL